MTRRAGRRPEPGSHELLWALLCGLMLLVVLLVVSAWGVAAWLHGPVAANPVAWLVDVSRGTAQWSLAASGLWGAGILLIAGAAGLFSLLTWRARGGRQRSRVDGLARSMSTPGDQRELEVGRLGADAARLRVSSVCGPAVPVGRSVLTGRALGSSWEWTQLWVMGTRAGKTTCVCVPQVVSTRGPVLVTSNKRDVVDLTRGPRSEAGKVWVHDPQRLVGERATWAWSPLSYTKTTERADEVVALFAAASRQVGAKTDAYFDTAAQTLLSALMLAGSLGGSSMSTVYDWVLSPEDREPEEKLRDAGMHRAADVVRAMRELTPKQRDGVYGSMTPLVSWARSETIMEWVDAPGGSVPVFDPDAFVRSRGTLYLISREGAGSARALTACLTAAVARAAEEYAIEQGGRLRVPLLCVLDEAANVCRWPELPGLYSHYGSRGIVLNTILQSWSQGVEVWGQEGMKKLWSAANVRGVGRGIGEEEFARAVSNLVGDHDVRTRSAVQGTKGHRSTSISNRREKILDVADVAALPKGRAVVLSSGVPPVLVRLVHWSELDREMVEGIRESQETFSAAGALTVGGAR